MELSAEACLLARAESQDRDVDGVPSLSALDATWLLEAVADAAFLVDQGGTVLWVNRRAARVLRREPGALVGKPLGEVFAPLSALGVDALVPDATGTGRVEVALPDTAVPAMFEYQIARRAPTCGVACAGCFAVFARDVTAHEALRDERDRLLRVAAVNDVLPSLLHELKTPLSSMTAAVELMMEDAVDPELQRSLHALLQEARRMRLNLDGIGSVGRQLRTRRYAAIDHAIEEACRVLASLARSRHVTMHSEIARMPLLPFEPSVVRAIVFNLVTNALHACSAGATVTVTARLVDLARVFELDVADTGTGMAPDVLKRCKELFYTTKSNGSGLGLALCETAARRAGGELALDSEPGRGTRVTLRVGIEPPG